MRSLLLASLASLAVRNVHAHSSGFTHSARLLSKRTVDLDAFRLVLDTEYTNSTQAQGDSSISSLAQADPQDVATKLVKTTVPGAQFRLVGDHYVGDNGIAHFYFKQTANDLDIDNADFNVNIGRNGEVFSFGNSFYKGDAPSALRKRDAVEPVNALKAAVNTLQLPISADKATAESTGNDSFTFKQTSGTVSEPNARLVYVQTAEGNLALAWRVETDIDTNWLLTYVDAENGEKVYHVIDYAADATYEVYPWGLNDPTEGSRVVIEDPFDAKASEFGWQSDGTATYKTTRGNNGIAQSNWNNVQQQSQYINLPRPTSAASAFEYPYSPEEEDWKSYVNASITQLFYTANKYHDLLYLLGFTEQAGNFELNNNGQGGKGADYVYLHAQDGAGWNNANFLTPVDGQAPRMRMYIWNYTTPFKDGAFEAGIVIHEYTHGLSTRLTGGPANSGCLNLVEAGGMGEGWGDFYATAIRLKPNDTRTTDYPMGAWAYSNPKGLRPYVYSTDTTTNPHVYKDVDGLTKVHYIGTVWATMLYEVLWNLIEKHGKNDAGVPDFDANGVPTDGKYLTMKLVLDGLALQPCNPTFVSAREAILDADKALTGGENQCEIWKGFAKRGLGTGAVYNSRARTNSFDVPEEC
ncbi:extracellular metallo proteinase MEP [Lentithecium fluviatile CBS 122367]|uniref:Extracellular metalloproteinase n=1 Tax=Lentithecium fluviatile CBS 122367 TaxID=1168545 RepID=A0A6G1INZ6_9PLEO|nr:extracellular metallo proteinase MEP [Lentithecium fluviatile CBS 122367]